MSDYRLIKTKIWTDVWFCTLSVEEKLVYLFLFTNGYTTSSGIYELSKGLVSPLAGAPNALSILEKFEKEDKVIYKDGFFFLKNFLKHQSWQLNNNENYTKHLTAYFSQNPKIVKLFNLENEEAYKPYLSPYPPPTLPPTKGVPSAYPDRPYKGKGKGSDNAIPPLGVAIAPPNYGMGISAAEAAKSGSPILFPSKFTRTTKVTKNPDGSFGDPNVNALLAEVCSRLGIEAMNGSGVKTREWISTLLDLKNKIGDKEFWHRFEELCSNEFIKKLLITPNALYHRMISFQAVPEELAKRLKLQIGYLSRKDGDENCNPVNGDRLEARYRAYTRLYEHGLTGLYKIFLDHRISFCQEAAEEKFTELATLENIKKLDALLAKYGIDTEGKVKDGVVFVKNSMPVSPEILKIISAPDFENNFPKVPYENVKII